MMVGTVPTSVPQIILMGNWLIGLNFSQKWLRLKSNKIFWVLSSVFLIHVIGLLYTNDLGRGWEDVRTKIPLMFLPMIFFSEDPLSKKEFRALLMLFVAGCVVNTAWCMIYSFILHHTETVRNSSRFMSHIRLGLYLNLAIAVLCYLIYYETSVLKRILFFGVAVYLLASMFVLGLATGMANFVLLFIAACLWITWRQSLPVKLISVTILLVFLFLTINYVSDIRHQQLDVNPTANNKPSHVSAGGNLYIHFDSIGQKENGNYVLMNIQLEELQRVWKREFPADSFNYDQQHNLGRYEVLVRYMASKGLNKDSAAYVQLNAQDKENIRKGFSNYQYPEWGFFKRRVYELVNEYDEFSHNRYINGHSLTMRLYFWKAAVHVAKDNLLFGVGTGDVQQELNKTYVSTKSPLEEEWYKRPHNQFLTITVALGLIGLLIFLVSLFYPVFILRKQLPVLFWPFFLLAIFSFFLEDTLETQAGLTFYAFFNSLFVSRAVNHLDTKDT